MQQSSVLRGLSKGDLVGQLSTPQTKLPAHCASESQSPSPSTQGLDSVQHPLSTPLHLNPEKHEYFPTDTMVKKS